MRVLVVTTEWPRFVGDISGVHIVDQVGCLKAAGLSVTVFHFSGRKNPFNYLKAIIDFKRLPFEEYEVIHAHHGQSGIVALSQNTVPVVVTFHGSDLQGIFDKNGNMTIFGYILKFVSHLVARWASEVIIVSEHLKAFIPMRSCHVIPIGVDAGIFFPIASDVARRKLSLPLQKQLVLFVGNPKRTEKRYWLAHKVVEQLKHEFDIKMVVADDVLHEMMPYFMNACDALLITSLSEGSPATVKEALACNLPIVSVDVGDIRQRIELFDGCVVCENDRPETIVGALRNVLSRNKKIDSSQFIPELDDRYLTQQVINVYRQSIADSQGRINR